MARIPPTNPKYRDKKTMASDAAFVLQSPLAYGTKVAVLTDIFWHWTEFTGKYHGCRYWSEAAHARRHRRDVKGLRHEHIVPKKVLLKMLFDLATPSTSAVRAVLDRFCVGIVVIKAEDERLNQAGLRSRMPEDWDEQDPWARYRAVGIRWIDTDAHGVTRKSSRPSAKPAAVVCVGVDRCKAGWLTMVREGDAIGARIFETFSELVAAFGESDIVVVDIPIGLLDTSPRTCEQLARQRIGPRRSSVFSTPVREVVAINEYSEANERHRELTGKGISQQAFHILPPIREVDDVLRAKPELRKRVFETHPEVAFWAADKRQVLGHPKKSAAGLKLRRRIIENRLGVDPFDSIRPQFTKAKVADDDIVDALIALWTAERVSRSEASSLPENPEVDRFGIEAAIWY